MIVTLKQILTKARRGKYAVGAFNINNLEVLEGIMAAALKEKSPVILQTSEGAIAHAGLDYLLAIMKVAAQGKVPVAMHLDHGKDLDIVEECIRSGYSSVMFDGSSLPFDENLKTTRRIATMAHKKGVSVEAELGALAGIEDLVSVKKKDSHLTDPLQAEVFAKKSGCDALAVAVGTSHGAFKFRGEPQLDFERLAEIGRRVKLPLVLHGASSVPKDLVANLNKHTRKLHQQARLSGSRGVGQALIRNAIKLGVAKVNVDTDLRIAFTGAVLNSLIEKKKIFDPREYLRPARDLVTQVVERKIRLFGSQNKA